MTPEQEAGIDRFKQQQRLKIYGVKGETLESLPYDGYIECSWVENNITFTGLFHPDDLEIVQQDNE